MATFDGDDGYQQHLGLVRQQCASDRIEGGLRNADALKVLNRSAMVPFQPIKKNSHGIVWHSRRLHQRLP